MPVTRATIGGKSINVEDVPLSVFADIEKETGISWTDIWGAPAANATSAVMFLEAVAQILGVECPELTPKTIMQIFHVEDGDHIPEAYDGGLPATMPDGSPLSESEQTTD
jgi:hypothetical protein